MKINKSMPKMVESSVIKARMLKDTEDMMSMPSPKKYDGMSEDRSPTDKEIMADHFAEGGEVKKKDTYKVKEDMGYGSIIMPNEDDDEPEEHHASIAAAIRAKAAKKKYAEGGMVDDQEQSDEDPNLKEDYSDFSHLDEMAMGEEENEDGPKMSMAARIRARK